MPRAPDPCETNPCSLLGLRRPQALVALFNAATPAGWANLSYDPTPLTLRQAVAILSYSTWVDEVQDRVFRCDFGADVFDAWYYDQAYGRGLAARVLTRLRQAQEDQRP